VLRVPALAAVEFALAKRFADAAGLWPQAFGIRHSAFIIRHPAFSIGHWALGIDP